jgi:hypothetical protein
MSSPYTQNKPAGVVDEKFDRLDAEYILFEQALTKGLQKAIANKSSKAVKLYRTDLSNLSDSWFGAYQNSKYGEWVNKPEPEPEQPNRRFNRHH